MARLGRKFVGGVVRPWKTVDTEIVQVAKEQHNQVLGEITTIKRSF